MASIGDTFKPGEKVPNSGIYDVLHNIYHHDRHQVTCVYGEPFRPADIADTTCGFGWQWQLYT